MEGGGWRVKGAGGRGNTDSEQKAGSTEQGAGSRGKGCRLQGAGGRERDSNKGRNRKHWLGLYKVRMGELCRVQGARWRVEG